MEKDYLLSRNLKYISYILGIIIVLSFSIFVQLSIPESLFLFLILGLAIFLWKKPFWGLLVLIILRPMIDRWGTTVFGPTEFSLNYNSLFGVLVILWGGYLIFQKKKEIGKLPAIILIFLFGCTLLLSLFLTPVFSEGLKEFLKLASIFILYGVSFLLIRNKKQLQQLIYAFLASSLVPLILGICQFVTGTGETDFGEYVSRIYGTFYYPNTFAFYLVFVIAILFLMFESSQKKLGKFIYFFLGFIAFLALLETYTRGAWIAAFVIFIAFGLLRFRKFLLGGILVLALMYIFVPILQERLSDIVSLEPFSSLVWRFRLWSNMLPFFYANPILGNGLSSFQVLSENLQGLSMSQVPEAHNDYLKLLIETGIVGLIFYLALYVRLLIFNFKHYLKTKDKFLKELSLTASVLLAVFLIASLGENILRGTATAWCLWSYFGGVAGLTIKKR